MEILKASGNLQDFSQGKLTSNLRRVGLREEDIDRVIISLNGHISQAGDRHLSTKDLRHLVAETLLNFGEGDGVKWRARYLLKEALYAMGPGGHNFEEYVGRLFAVDGFEVAVATILQGKCVTHEVDVYAKKEGQYNFVECKFHNDEGTRTEVTVAMYTHARFRDLHNGHESGHSHPPRPDHDHNADHAANKGHVDVGWLATNTKLTEQALDYARCANIQVLSLYLPEHNSITDRVFSRGLFPITSLSPLKSFAGELIPAGFVLARDVERLELDQAQSLGISQEQLMAAKLEAAAL
jgi:hypothetical protein